MTKRIGRKWLLSVCVVPVAWAGVATADPWLEKSPTAGQGWEDIPFLGPPQRPANQRQPRSPETTRALESKRELQRELHRLPETNRAANPKSAVNVFPPPRVPQQPRTAEQPSDAQPVPPAIPAPPAVAVRATRPAELPHKPSRTAAARPRDGEQELQRELNRTLPPTAVPPVGEPLACAERLAKIARYSPLPSRTGPGACGATDLVQLDSVVMSDRTIVALNPAPQIKCSMAEQFAEWVREDVGPAATAELGSPLLSISDNDAYDCRTRNHIKGAPLSEHGKGNALDITGIRLRNGGVFTLADQLVAKSFRDKVRLAACGRFMTVLGPGSDAYHGDHVHLDMAERTRKFKVCQWNVRETVVASHAEPEPPRRAASAPPVAAAPFVPPPPKVDAKIEPPAQPDPSAIAAAEEQVKEQQAKEQAQQEQAKQELVQQEQAKQELARQEHARQEQARQEQAKQELARQEQARQERARQEQAKQELARQEQARQEQARQEQARQEQARQEQARQEQARQEQARQEQARQEQARQEQARQEQARQEQARQEQARQERARQEQARQEQARQEQARQEQARQEQARQQELARQEQAWQRELARQEQAKQQLARQEQKEEASPPQAAETEQPAILSPPLPRRKPEALLTLAQLQQSDMQSRTEPETRGERPRSYHSYHYDSRRRFERDIRRFIRNFF